MARAKSKPAEDKNTAAPVLITPSGAPADDLPPRDRILCAAYDAFCEKGYAETSTLEIATRAKVSKREIYSQFGNKKGVLEACIASRVNTMTPPGDIPPATSPAMLETILARFGVILLREMCRPEVLAVFRLAITEAVRSPEVAQLLDTQARGVVRNALAGVVAPAQASGLLREGDAGEMAAHFLALLWGNLLMGLLLRVAEPPDDAETNHRAASAAAAFVKFYGVGG